MYIEQMKKIFSVCLLVFMTIWAMAQTQTERFVPGSTLEGVCYYLPQTAFRVVVTAEKTVVRPGDFAKYAFHYLRLQDVPTQETTSWKITKVELQPYGVPDKNKAHTILLKSKTVAPLVGLSRDGILLSINTDAEEETLPELPKRIPAEKLQNPRDYMNQEMLSAGSTAKMAELVAQEIYDMRDSRNALIRGEADNTPKDGKQLQLMLDQLDKQIAALQSMFSGTTQTSTEVASFSIIPTEQTEKQMICRFSQKLGIVDADDLSGAPVCISVKALESLPDPVEDPNVKKKQAKMEKGVYYNVPVLTRLKIFDARETYAELETPMAQFGVEQMLSNTLFDKKTETKVTFFQSTGGTKDVIGAE